MMDCQTRQLIRTIEAHLQRNTATVIEELTRTYETLFFLGFSVAAVRETWEKQFPGKNSIPFPKELETPRVNPNSVSRDDHLAHMHVLHHLGQLVEGLHWIGTKKDDPPHVYVGVSFKRLILAQCLTAALFPDDMDECVRTLNRDWRQRHAVAPFLNIGNAEPSYWFLCKLMPLPTAHIFHESSVLDAYVRAVCECRWANSRAGRTRLFSTEMLTGFLRGQIDVYKRPQGIADDYEKAVTRVMEIARTFRPLSFASPRSTYVRALRIADLSGVSQYEVNCQLKQHFERHRVQLTTGVKTLNEFRARLGKQLTGNQQLRELMFF